MVKKGLFDMNSTTIENWLRSSLLGVIILGAIGSILAILLFKSIQKVMRWFGIGLSIYKKREYNIGFRVGVVLGYIKVTKDPIKAVFFVSYLLARLLVACLMAIILLVLFFGVLPSKGSNILNLATYLTIFLFFLAIRWVFEEFRNIRTIYRREISNIVAAVKKHKDEKKSETKSEEDKIKSQQTAQGDASKAPPLSLDLSGKNNE